MVKIHWKAFYFYIFFFRYDYHFPKTKKIIKKKSLKKFNHFDGDAIFRLHFEPSESRYPALWQVRMVYILSMYTIVVITQFRQKMVLSMVWKCYIHIFLLNKIFSTGMRSSGVARNSLQSKGTWKSLYLIFRLLLFNF